MTLTETLLVISKPARMGLGKTRLARDIGKAEAQRLNRMSQSHSFRAAQGPWETILSVAPDTAVTECRYSGFHAIPQGTGDLGDRLIRAFATMPPGPVMLIATDAPDVSSHHIRRAFIALRSADMVMGPADDGGFWLCGVSSRTRRRWRTNSPFNPVRWSSEWAMADVVANMPDHARITYLETLIDLDDAASLQKWQSRKRR